MFFGLTARIDLGSIAIIIYLLQKKVTLKICSFCILEN